MNLPNFLTVCRLFLAPLFVFWFFYPPMGWVWAPVLVLALSGLTDVLDGHIARKYNLITQLGQFLDPLADKITIFAVVICLAVRHPAVRILLIFYVIKEVTLALIGFLQLRTWKKSPPARWYGKAATVLLYALFFLVLLVPTLPQEAILALSAAPAVFMVLSFIFYLKEINKRKKGL